MAKADTDAAELAKSLEAGSPISAHLQARILAEALPNMLRYDEQTVVVKFGGHAMGDEALSDAFAQDIVYLKQSGVNPIVVHGGGPQIANMLKKLEIKIGIRQRAARHRQADRGESSRWCSLALINKEHRLGHQPAGRQGGRHLRQGRQSHDRAQRITEMPDPESNIMKAVDIGFVGDPFAGQSAHRRCDLEIRPHSGDRAGRHVSREGETLNINADTFASALAARMQGQASFASDRRRRRSRPQGRSISSPDLTIDAARRS